jgi:hypothetical protein
MAIFDALFEFSDAQDITGDAQSTNVIDMVNADLEMGTGQPLYLNVRVGPDDFAGGTSLVVNLYAHTAATSIESGTLIFATGTILQAALTAGAWITRVALPVDFDTARYVGLYYNDTGAFSTGAINAWLDHGPQSSYDTQVAASNIS